MGNEADWINNGRCKIQWKTLKPNKKRVYDTHTKWVAPATLTAPQPEAQPEAQPAAGTEAATASPASRRGTRSAR